MTKELRGPILGVTIAIVINAAMNAAGLSSLSFASLFPLMLIFWFIQRLPRKSMGFALGGVATLCFSATAPFGNYRSDCADMFGGRCGRYIQNKLAIG